MLTLVGINKTGVLARRIRECDTPLLLARSSQLTTSTHLATGVPATSLALTCLGPARLLQAPLGPHQGAASSSSSSLSLLTAPHWPPAPAPSTGPSVLVSHLPPPPLSLSPAPAHSPPCTALPPLTQPLGQVPSRSHLPGGWI